jgi:hypothetical protein
MGPQTGTQIAQWIQRVLKQGPRQEPYGMKNDQYSQGNTFRELKLKGG